MRRFLNSLNVHPFTAIALVLVMSGPCPFTLLT